MSNLSELNREQLEELAGLSLEYIKTASLAYVALSARDKVPAGLVDLITKVVGQRIGYAVEFTEEELTFKSEVETLMAKIASDTLASL